MGITHKNTVLQTASFDSYESSISAPLLVQLADTKKEDSSLEPSSKTQNNSQIQISQTHKSYKFHSQNLVRYPNSLVL